MIITINFKGRKTLILLTYIIIKKGLYQNIIKFTNSMKRISR